MAIIKFQRIRESILKLRLMMGSSPTPDRRGRKLKSLDAFPEGVFFKVQDMKSMSDSTSSTDDSTTSSSCTTPLSSPPASWKTTETKSFLLHQPLMVSDPESDEPEPLDVAEALGRAMQRSRALPGTWYYSSNHVMVNQERIKRVMAPLSRLSELDSIAREHAQAMADRDQLFHSDPVELQYKFNRPTRRMGENVAVGASIRDIHKRMMEETESDKHNILHRCYTHMGMATAKGADGQLYLCQVFRG